MDINQVWPEWREDCLLGEGSFGKVFRAKRVEYGHTFYSAIKIISVPKTQQEIKNARAQGMNDTEIYNYFQSLVDNLINEITLMENLKGAKNIVGIDDYKIIEHEGEIGWDIFIRMELLTAFDSFVSNPQFSQKDVVRLGIDICTALETCEQNNIIHRDIKPDNIFISKFGEYKLGDFGIARKLEATQANLSRKGTLNYMAPEVYKGEDYGTSVDIYSLGLVLYTMLNNNRVAFLPPYPQQITYNDNEEALSKRLSGEPMEPPCNASESLGAVILRACAYNPYDRYISASEFKNALIIEWNKLAQTGDNRGIYSEMSPGVETEDERLKYNTNDMTDNGTLLYDKDDPDQSGYTATTSKTSKPCRVISFILAAVLLVLSVGLLISSKTLFIKSIAAAMIGVAVITLIARNNRIGIGICMAACSLGYIAQSLAQGLLKWHDGDAFPVLSLVWLIAGILVLAGGIAVIAQREPRTGGALFVYALAIEWLYYGYSMLNGGITIKTWHMFFALAELTAFMWAYGYDSTRELGKAERIINIITCVFAGAAFVFCLLNAVAMFKSA